MKTIYKPLGLVELPTGPYAVFPMNDIFLNYTFENEEYWETLRQIVNIVKKDFKSKFPHTVTKPITGKIKVRTQYKQFAKGGGKTPLSQDFQILEDSKDASFTEFQMQAVSKPIIEVRSVKYFGLGISQSSGGRADQIWFLGEDVESLLHGVPITNYILKDEATGNIHPETSSIMFVSLTELSKEKSQAGELALLLLGKLAGFMNKDVRKIAKMLKKGFEDFRNDKEALMLLSLEERKRLEGEAIGEARGVAIGQARGVAIGEANLAKLVKQLFDSGTDPNEIVRLLINRTAPAPEADA